MGAVHIRILQRLDLRLRKLESVVGLHRDRFCLNGELCMRAEALDVRLVHGIHEVEGLDSEGDLGLHDFFISLLCVDHVLGKSSADLAVSEIRAVFSQFGVEHLGALEQA